MKLQEVSQVVLAEKYLKGDETSAESLFARVAKGIAQAEATPKARARYEREFLEMLNSGAIGGGRIMSAAGTDIKATLINCFVQPVGDCIQGKDDDGYPGIYEALREAAETMRRGGGVGYDFSRIRPKGAKVKGTQSEASGPCSYMNVFDQSCSTVESAGARRGAQMGVLRIDHPDVMEFVTAKRTPGRWNNFNVSLFVEDAFFAALEADSSWDLVHSAEPCERFKQTHEGVHQRDDGKWVYATISAKELWDVVMRSNYDFAEPGILLGSNINKENNLWYCETLAASNPCAEQMLPSYGCCDLGQVILPKFVKNPFSNDAGFDWQGFRKTVATLVRFLDNVLDVTHWPLPQQKLESDAKRRIGIGYTGLGSTMAMLGLVYGSPEGNEFAELVAENLRNTAYQASMDLAKERGAFPAFKLKEYLEGEFTIRLPRYIRDDIVKYGIRNSHLLSIAPTGTVSLAFGDNCSNGIEPIFSLAYLRNKRTADGGKQQFAVMDHALRVFVEVGDVSRFVGDNESKSFKLAMLDAICAFKDVFEFNGQTIKVADVLPPSFVTAQTLTVEQHLSVMAAVQPYIDSAISKTINVPADYPFDDFKRIYARANELGLKGVACYRPNQILGAVLEVAPKQEQAASVNESKDLPVADLDPSCITLDKRPAIDLDAVVKKVAYSGPDGDASMYLTVSFADVAGVVSGQEVVVERPVEVFISAHPDGVPSEWVTTYARTLSLLARSGIKLLAKALHDGRSVRSDKGRYRYGHYEKIDGTRVPRFHASDVALIAFAVQEILMARGVLDVDGNPVPTRVRSRSLQVRQQAQAPEADGSQTVAQNKVVAGKPCKACGAHAVIKKDGCEFCTHCGEIGSCG